MKTCPPWNINATPPLLKPASEIKPLANLLYIPPTNRSHVLHQPRNRRLTHAHTQSRAKLSPRFVSHLSHRAALLSSWQTLLNSQVSSAFVISSREGERERAYESGRARAAFHTGRVLLSTEFYCSCYVAAAAAVIYTSVYHSIFCEPADIGRTSFAGKRITQFRTGKKCGVHRVHAVERPENVSPWDTSRFANAALQRSFGFGYGGGQFGRCELRIR